MNKYSVTTNEKTYEVTLISRDGTSLEFSINEKVYSVNVAPLLVKSAPSASASHASPIISSPSAPTARRSAAKVSNAVVAPMPGIVVSLAVKAGDTVTKNAVLLVMEAMKMENNITSPRDGKIKSVAVSPGQEVENGQLLVAFE